MSETVVVLRSRHAHILECITNLRATSAPVDVLGTNDSPRVAGLTVSALGLWEAKLIQIHTAALAAGDELYPVDHEGRCSECQLDVHALQRMHLSTTAPEL
jgi:hypothetical protein